MLSYVVYWEAGICAKPERRHLNNPSGILTTKQKKMKVKAVKGRNL